jgi:hypothetical protein
MSIKYTQRGRSGSTDCVYTPTHLRRQACRRRFSTRTAESSIALRTPVVQEARIHRSGSCFSYASQLPSGRLPPHSREDQLCRPHKGETCLFHAAERSMAAAHSSTSLFGAHDGALRITLHPRFPYRIGGYFSHSLRTANFSSSTPPKTTVLSAKHSASWPKVSGAVLNRSLKNGV